MKNQIYDLLGIGIGPFNLGLAALSHSLDLQTVFFDQSPQFNWHPGLLIERTTLQVPYLADLVTTVEPTSPFTFINYIHQRGRLFKFCIKESFYITRKEYNNYCQWVASQLEELRFSHRVTDIEFNRELDCYEVEVHDLIQSTVKTYRAKNLALGTGSVPMVPSCAKDCTKERVFHSSQYLHRKKYLKKGSTLTVIGSGQSGGEIFMDLLQELQTQQYKLNWITAAPRFFPMENSKLTYEFTSADYQDYFFDLAPLKKRKLIHEQNVLYKGMNQDLIGEIYDEMYYQELYSEAKLPVKICANTRLDRIEASTATGCELDLYQTEQDCAYSEHSDYVILATGYRHDEPEFLENIDYLLNRNENGQLVARKDYSVDVCGGRVFILNGALESHGILTADLGMGPYRNARILNSILKVEKYKLEEGIAFQDFGVHSVSTEAL